MEHTEKQTYFVALILYVDTLADRVFSFAKVLQNNKT